MRMFRLASSAAILLLVATVVALTPNRATAASTAFAYITYEDGSIDQYKINPTGKFIFLKRGAAEKELADSAGTTVSDAAGVAFELGQFGAIGRYKVNKDGTLTFIKKAYISQTVAPAEDMAIDPHGRFMYITVLGTGLESSNGTVVQYRINSDGSISPLTPKSVPTGYDPGAIVFHPTKPYVYVSNDREGTISQYHMKANGQLTPMKPAKVDVAGRTGSIAFSHDGRYAFVISIMGRSIVQCSISDSGALTPIASGSYADELNTCCGYPDIVVSPNNVVLISDSMGMSLHIFRLTNGKINDRPSRSYKVTRDNKLRTREEITAIRDKQLAEKGLPIPNLPYYEDAGTIDNLLTQSCKSLWQDKEGCYYLLTLSGVVRFKLKDDDSVIDMEPAVYWEDMIAAMQKNEQKGQSKLKGLRFPDRMTIVYR